MLPLLIVFYFIYPFFLKILYSLNTMQIAILIIVLILIIILFLYFLNKKYWFAVDFANFLFFIIKPFYLAITNFFNFFFIEPAIIIYNLKRSDWELVGVYVIIGIVMSIFFYFAYLFACMCLEDLR